MYGNRGNGQTYGWTIDNAAQTRDRNASNSPDQRYDTLTHFQKPANPDAIWEIAVVNGTYRVRVVSGDASNFDSVFRTTAEGVLVVNGTPTTSTRWVEGTSTVVVTDGRLTIRSGAARANNKICFVEISPGLEQSPREAVHGRHTVARFRRVASGRMVSPRASMATSVAIARVRPAGVFMLFVRKASANRFARPRSRNCRRARGSASMAAREILPGRFASVAAASARRRRPTGRRPARGRPAAVRPAASVPLR